MSYVFGDLKKALIGRLLGLTGSTCLMSLMI